MTGGTRPLVLAVAVACAVIVVLQARVSPAPCEAQLCPPPPPVVEIAALAPMCPACAACAACPDCPAPTAPDCPGCPACPAPPPPDCPAPEPPPEPQDCPEPTQNEGDQPCRVKEAPYKSIHTSLFNAAVRDDGGKRVCLLSDSVLRDCFTYLGAEGKVQYYPWLPEGETSPHFDIARARGQYAGHQCEHLVVSLHSHLTISKRPFDQKSDYYREQLDTARRFFDAGSLRSVVYVPHNANFAQITANRLNQSPAENQYFYDEFNKWVAGTASANAKIDKELVNRAHAISLRPKLYKDRLHLNVCGCKELLSGVDLGGWEL